MKFPRKCLYVSSAVTGLLLIFFLPYLFPNSTPALSASYDFGFNNKIGILLTGLFAIAFIVYGYLSPEIDEALFLRFGHSDEISRKRLFATLGISLCLCLLIWCIGDPIFEKESWGFGESGYFISHLMELSLGKIPYKDFEFCYGSLYLYVPWLVHLILPFFSIASAYFLTVTIVHLMGVCFLYEFLGELRVPLKEKNAAFTLIAIITFPWDGGLNYTIFRFILPAYLFYRLHKTEYTPPPYTNAHNTYYNMYKYSSLVFIFSGILLNTSTELGLSFCFAVVVYSVFKFYFERKTVYFVNIFLPVAAGVLTFLALPDMFQQIFGFVSGGLNWPFIVSFVLIVFFCCIFVLSFAVGLQFRNIRANLFELSFELMAFGFVPAALGRCDPGHVYFNGLFIIILAYVFLRNHFTGRKTILVNIIFVLLFLTGVPYSLFCEFRNYGSVMAETLIYTMSRKDSDKIQIPHLILLGGKFAGIENVDNKIEQYRKRFNSSLETYTNGLYEEYEEKLGGGVRSIAVPFNCSNHIYVWLHETGRICPLYFRSPGTVGSKVAVERNYQTLVRNSPEALILPIGWEKISEYQDQKRILRILFLAPYPVIPQFNGNELYNPTIHWIKNNYDEFGLLNETEIIMERKKN